MRLNRFEQYCSAHGAHLAIKITAANCYSQFKLRTMPAVAILGPRQCGKTTLAQEMIADSDRAVYLDLERRADLNKLDVSNVPLNKLV